MATPTITQTTQTYQGIPIVCARIVCTEACSFKFQGIVNAPDDYLFQLVVKANAARTLTITCGGSVDTLDITSSFDRYVMAFPDVAVADNDSLYIDFPAGTYYLYNLQLERGTNATKWQPAPEDAAAYSDKAAAAAVDAQTQRDIFNKLTNNGETQGIYLNNGKLYLNATYLNTGYINAELVEIRNLIADHLRSYGNGDTWMLESQASYLDLRQLVSAIWKQRVGIYITPSGSGYIRLSNGDVDANGNPLTGDSNRTFLSPGAIWIGQDKNGSNTGDLYCDEIHCGSVASSGAISGGALTCSSVSCSGTATFKYVNADTIGAEKATNALTSANSSWSFNITGVRMLCIVGRTGRIENQSALIPTASITTAETLWGWTDSTGTTQFAIKRSGSTCTVTLKSIPSGGRLVSAYAVI